MGPFGRAYKQLQLWIHHEAYQTVQLKTTPLPKSKPKIDQFREKKPSSSQLLLHVMKFSDQNIPRVQSLFISIATASNQA
jgi:hypothetical protein